MHRWGDEGVDWAGINDAAEFIATTLIDAGVLVHDYKEKWGTVRVYCSLESDAQINAYKDVYRKAVGKWPHLKQEILSGADYSELLSGEKS